ncbi:aminoacyl-tRNA hydrolase [Candidatus Parcubacteria bacterium]|nr:aminoacyl-tRNA hydrolase [Candidatus Parcubacteria bacterium]
MSYIIAGLGNPGEEFEGTRHNTGRMVVEALAKKFSFSEFKDTPKIKARTSTGAIEKENIQLVEPDNYMNRSGVSLAPLITSVKKAQNLIVVYDDLDLPLGTLKVSYNRSAGGHRGLDSIIKALKTQEFIRVRVGISPVTPSGKIKKPSGDDAVDKHIIGQFKKPELDILKKVIKQAVEAVEVIVTEGKEAAMGKFNI